MLQKLLLRKVGKKFIIGRLANVIQDILPIYLLHFGPSNTIPVEVKDINVTVLLFGYSLSRWWIMQPSLLSA